MSTTTRINPESLHRSPFFSQAVRVPAGAATVYVGGQNGVDADGKVVGPTVGEQARQAFRNLATILESEGASLANIVHWTIAVVDGHAVDEGFAAFQQVGNPPDPTAGHHGPRRRRAGPRVPRRDRCRRRRVTPQGPGYSRGANASQAGERSTSMLQRVEMDKHVTLFDQLTEEVGPVILVNTFQVAPEDADALLDAWAADAAYLKAKPGFISTQLHRGIAGSSTFLNVAVWESIESFRAAFSDPTFQETWARYPDSTVASPHLFQKVAVPGICVDR